METAVLLIGLLCLAANKFLFCEQLHLLDVIGLGFCMLTLHLIMNSKSESTILLDSYSITY